MMHRPRTFVRNFLGIVILTCFPTTSFAQGGYPNAQKLRAGEFQIGQLMRGYDIRLNQIRNVCLSGQPETFNSGDPLATLDFSYVSSMNEIYEREETATSVQAQVQYAGVGVSTDVRDRQMKEAKNLMENGAIHGYFQDGRPVQWVGNRTLRLTEEAQALHDEAVQNRRMEHFYARCGDGAVLGLQESAFLQVIVTLKHQSGMSREETSRSIQAGVDVAISGFGASAAVGHETGHIDEESFEKTHFKVHAKSSGETPDCEGSNDMTKLAVYVDCFRASPSARTLNAIFVVPYSDFIEGFGQLPGDIGVPEALARAQKILDGLAFLEAAEVLLRRSDDARAEKALRLVSADENRSSGLFVQEDACLFGSKQCDELFARFSLFPVYSSRAVTDFVEVALRQSSCGPLADPYFNGNGFLSCLQCPLEKQPLFTNGRAGACGYLEPVAEDNVVRLTMADLATTEQGLIEVGVVGTVTKRPSTCPPRSQPDARCGWPVAHHHCRRAGYAQSLTWKLRAFSPSYYADGTVCNQREEDRRPAPRTCATFVYIDCLCPVGQVVQAPGSQTCVPQSGRLVANENLRIIEFDPNSNEEEAVLNLRLQGVLETEELDPVIFRRRIDINPNPEE